MHERRYSTAERAGAVHPARIQVILETQVRRDNVDIHMSKHIHIHALDAFGIWQGITLTTRVFLTSAECLQHERQEFEGAGDHIVTLRLLHREFLQIGTD